MRLFRRKRKPQLPRQLAMAVVDDALARVQQPGPPARTPAPGRICTGKSRYAHFPRPEAPLRPLCPAGNSGKAQWVYSPRAYYLDLCAKCADIAGISTDERDAAP